MKTLESAIPHHSTAPFTYAKKEKTFITEVSNLKDPLCSQIYDDACDEGFYLVSHKSNIKKLFFYDKTIQEGNEVISWEFKNNEGYKAIIFND